MVLSKKNLVSYSVHLKFYVKALLVVHVERKKQIPGRDEHYPTSFVPALFVHCRSKGKCGKN